MNNKLKNAKNICIAIAVISVINTVTQLIQFIQLIMVYKWDSYDVYNSIYMLVYILLLMISTSSFSIFSVLTISYLTNKVNDVLENKLLKAYIILQVTYTILAFAMAENIIACNYIVLLIANVAVLIFFIITFAGITNKPSKIQLTLLIVMLIYLIINIFIFLLSGILSMILYIISLFSEVILIICYLTKKLSSPLLYITVAVTSIFNIIALILMGNFSIISILSTFIVNSPIFLYSLFYNDIKQLCSLQSPSNIEDELSLLQEKYNSGEISIEEYDRERQAIIDKI